MDEDLDHGAIIMQKAVEVADDDTAESLAAKILEQEHALYIKSLKLIVEGKVLIENRKVLIESALTESTFINKL